MENHRRSILVEEPLFTLLADIEAAREELGRYDAVRLGMHVRKISGMRAALGVNAMLLAKSQVTACRFKSRSRIAFAGFVDVKAMRALR